MVRAFHKTTFIVSHFGGILYFHYMPWLEYDNVFFESSGIMDQLISATGRAGLIIPTMSPGRSLGGLRTSPPSAAPRPGACPSAGPPTDNNGF